LRKHPKAFIIVHTVRRTIIATMAVIPVTFTDVESTETDNVLGANDNDREIQASHGVTAIAANLSLHINDAEPSVPETSYEGRGTGPLEAAEQQGTNRTYSAFNTDCSDEFLNSLAESSGRTPASTTASALSSPTLVDGNRAIADMANITITKIIDKRIGSSGFQYKCELKPVWVPVNLVENAQMGPVCIRSYEKWTHPSGTPRDVEK
jgi:hypothetical protein